MNAGVLPAADVTAVENLSENVGFFMADGFINLFSLKSTIFGPEVCKFLCLLDVRAKFRSVNVRLVPIYEKKAGGC